MLSRINTLAASCLLACSLAALPALAAENAPPASSAELRFAISGFDLQGNTLLPQAEIAALLAAYTGPSRSFADIGRAVDALQALYVSRGWSTVLVQLPEQELDDQIVKLRVLEPRLRQVRVEGNKHFSESNVRAALVELREGASLRMDRLSANVRMANTSPARQVTVGLEGSDDPALLDAVVRVSDQQPWRLALNADNTGTPSTGRTRLSFVFQHANLGDRDVVASFQYGTTAQEPSKVSLLSGGLRVPLYALGDSLDLFATHSNVDAGKVSAGALNLQVSGQGTMLGARYNRTLAPLGQLTSTLTGGVDWRAYKNDVSLEGTPIGDEVRVHPMSLGWSGLLPLASSGQLALQLTGVRNAPGGTKGSQADLERQRSGTRGDYRLIRYSTNWSQPMGNWLLRAQWAGQASQDALLPAEQFGAGGATTVRGFREREIAGDQGSMAGVELQSPNLCTGDWAALQCRGLGFLDGGSVRRNKALPGEELRSAIASAGLGVRLTLDRRASLSIDWARVLDPSARGAAGDHRLHVTLSISP